ncbi:TIR domain-containing protein, partial [archaeon]|nr:TIR domain-containing protein [archaeon]
KEEIGDNKKIFFMQTHTDHKMAELNDRRLIELLESGQIIDNIKICPKNGDGIKQFKELLLKDDQWNSSRTMIQTTYYDSVLKVIMELQKRKKSVFVLKEFNDLYEELNGDNTRVPENHLKYILNNYSDQGIIDYLPNLSNLIIIYDEDYNKLKSEIPIFVMKHSGIVNYADLVTEFKKEEYIKIIDGLYNTYNISIENYDQRIFPKFLKKEESNISDRLLSYIKEGQSVSLVFEDQKIDQFKILSILSDMKGLCVDASRNDAIFTWADNVILYYNYTRIGNAVDGFIIKINIRIGGKNEKIFNRSLDDFINNLSSLFGSYTYETEKETKKKLDLEDRDIIYDVALSFAGEQRTYVNEVANLIRSEGLVVFYDEFYEGKLWGEDLTEYLWRVYYKESSFCMIFISKEYVSKAWPTHEKKAAIAKEVKKMGGYILPVRFDYSEVPGLAPGIKYIKANGLWPSEGEGKNPDEIFSLFREKITPS